MAPLAIKLFVLICYAICRLPSIAANRYNITMAEMDRCKEYDIDNKQGYAYKDFFVVDTFDNNKIESNERMHLKFYVMTTMDAHILLSVTNAPRSRDRVYEIVIGAGRDTFSTIRTQMGFLRVALNQDKNLLSQYDPTPIEIIQTKDAQLLVYIPGHKAEPLLNYTDASGLDIKYMSFGSYGSTSAKWFYDCEFDGFGQEIMQEVRVQTPRQRLLADLRRNGENSSVPVDLQSVTFGIQVKSLAYDEPNSTLTTRMHLSMDWQDPRLQWDPREYSAMEMVVQSSLDIWTPTIMALNGRLIMGANELKVQHNGNISLRSSNVEITSRCVNNRRNWPNEHLNCELQLGLHEYVNNPTEQLKLEYSGEPFSHEPISMSSEWQFTSLSLASIENSTLARYSERGILQAMDGDVVIQFDIEHNAYFYKNVFMVPLFACQCLMTLSFVLQGYRRGGLVLLVFIILIMGLMFATKRGPHAYVPNIMIAYQHMLRMATACYMLHIIIMWLELYPPSFKPSDWLMAILKSSVFRFICGLRLFDTDLYMRIERNPWYEVAKALNRCSFLIYQGIFIAINVIVLPDSSC